MPKYLTSFFHGRNVPDREHKRSKKKVMRQKRFPMICVTLCHENLTRNFGKYGSLHLTAKKIALCKLIAFQTVKSL